MVFPKRCITKSPFWVKPENTHSDTISLKRINNLVCHGNRRDFLSTSSEYEPSGLIYISAKVNLLMIVDDCDDHGI